MQKKTLITSILALLLFCSNVFYTAPAWSDAGRLTIQQLEKMTPAQIKELSPAQISGIPLSELIKLDPRRQIVLPAIIQERIIDARDAKYEQAKKPSLCRCYSVKYDQDNPEGDMTHRDFSGLASAQACCSKCKTGLTGGYEFSSQCKKMSVYYPKGGKVGVSPCGS